MHNAAIQRNEQLRRGLDDLVRTGQHISLATLAPSDDGPSVDVVVTANEMNDKHGTGPLVRRIFQGCPNIFSIRARNHYGGEHDFGEAAVLLSQEGVSRPQAFLNVLSALQGRRVRRIACVPYFVDDLLTSIALKELFDAPLCGYIMDDQNVAVNAIPDPLMREFLAKCSVRFATHPELRAAYESKFGLPFWLLPAVTPAELTWTGAQIPVGPLFDSGTGALVGSLWSQRWLDLLCHAVGSSAHALDWYGNNKSPCFPIRMEQLDGARIRARGLVPEPRLAELLRSYPYAVVPTGTIEGEAGNARALAQLSLPGRILFIAATSNTPIIVMGSELTSAARFVERFDIGITTTYSPQAFRGAVERVTAPDTQRRMRANAAAIATALSAKDIGAWVWHSTEIGRASDERFEALLPRRDSDRALSELSVTAATSRTACT